MWDTIFDTVLDTIKIVPILFLFYLLTEFLETTADLNKLLHNKFQALGPVFGALLGCIPQCGFATAAATLYNSSFITASTLIAVFLSTSDEAIPILLAHFSDLGVILQLIVSKIIIAILAGYLLKMTVFRGKKICQLSTATIPNNSTHCDYTHSDCTHAACSCHKNHGSVFINALSHTIKISLFILGTMFAVNTLVFFIGQDTLSSLLLSHSTFQPCLTAFFGLIPGCTTSVILTELFLSGNLSFGATVAGLSSAAGFGFLVLFKDKKNLKNAFKIIFYTFLCAAIAGMAIQQFMLS